MFKLLEDPRFHFRIAPASSLEGEFPKKPCFFPGRERMSVFMIGGKLVVQVPEGELEPVGKMPGVTQSSGMVLKERSELPGGLEVTFGIGCEESACLVEGGVVAQAGEGVSKETVPAPGKKWGIGYEKRDLKVAGKVDQELIASFLATKMVAGESEVEIAPPEGLAEPGSSFEKA